MSQETLDKIGKYLRSHDYLAEGVEKPTSGVAWVVELYALENYLKTLVNNKL